MEYVCGFAAVNRLGLHCVPMGLDHCAVCDVKIKDIPKDKDETN
jgi:hypothetical protein